MVILRAIDPLPLSKHVLPLVFPGVFHVSAIRGGWLQEDTVTVFLAIRHPELCD